MKPSKHLLTLPDKTHLGIINRKMLTIRKIRGKEPLSAKYYPTFFNREFFLPVKEKEDQAIVALLSSRGPLKVIACDFDRLPDGFGSYLQLSDYLKLTYKNALILTTFSGKVKLFFLTRTTQKYPTYHEVRRLQEEYFNKHNDAYGLFNWIDASRSAQDRAFMTPSNLDIFRSWIKSAKVIELPEHEFQYDENIKVPAFFYEIGRGKNFENFVKLILSIAALRTEKGFCLPTTKLAAQLGTNQPQVSRYIKILVDNGVLRCLSPKYKLGAYAKRYKLTNRFQREYLKTHLHKPVNISSEWPSEINDGEWNRTAFILMASRWQDWKTWIPKVRLIEGVNRGRLRHFTDAVRSWFKFNGKTPPDMRSFQLA